MHDIRKGALQYEVKLMQNRMVEINKYFTLGMHILFTSERDTFIRSSMKNVIRIIVANTWTSTFSFQLSNEPIPLSCYWMYSFHVKSNGLSILLTRII